MHHIILTKTLITKTLLKAKERADPNYPDTGCARRILDLKIIQFAKDAARDGWELYYLPCSGCRAPLYEGEYCVSKRRGRNTGRSYYHAECAQKLHILE